jgi:hypothetical protein
MCAKKQVTRLSLFACLAIVTTANGCAPEFLGLFKGSHRNEPAPVAGFKDSNTASIDPELESSEVTAPEGAPEFEPDPNKKYKWIVYHDQSEGGPLIVSRGQVTHSTMEVATAVLDCSLFILWIGAYFLPIYH